MNFFQGFFYRPGDPGTNNFFLKYGMSFFCWEYFLLMFLSVTVVITMIILLKLKNFDIYKQMRVCLVITTCLEILKILFFTINRKNVALESWLPLFYCSLFNYALYFAAFGKKFVRQMGVSAIFMLVVAGICGVFVNDIFTGRGYPLFNFYTFYTITYHTIMIYFGYAVIITKQFQPNWKNFFAGILFVTIFFVIALIINLICHTNLMSMMPYRIQTPMLYDIGSILGDKLVPLVMYFYYTIGVFAIALLPYYIMWIIKLFKLKTKKNTL